MRRRLPFIALLMCWGLAAAQPPAAQRHRIEQPAQPLADSLLAIARQTGASVVFDPAAVQGVRARPVVGNLSAAEAMARAAQGTGLKIELVGDGVIAVVPPALPASAPAANPPPAAASSPKAGRVEAQAVRIAQATPPDADTPAGGSGADSSADRGAGARQVTRVEITGSRLRRLDSEAALPVNVYTRADIDRSGQPTLERFLASLNEVSISPGESSFGSTTGQGSVQLRGLPVGSTLVLLNGRRLQAVGSSTGNYFNLNLIPLAAVERVEIVPVGSSAVYGGDALAGVVNIILKKSVDGLAFSARVSSGRGFGDGGASLALGAQDQDGAWLVLGSYSKATPLNAGEREFFRDADYRRFGGVDARTRNCTPGTVTSSTSAPLPGLASTVAAIPSLMPGQPLGIEGFLPGAGQDRRCSGLSNANGSALAYGNEALSLHASGHRQFGDRLSLFGELTLVRDRLRVHDGGLVLNNVLVPASNAFNPFGVPVRVTARLDPENGTEGFVRHTDYTRVLLGARGGLGRDWDWEGSVSTSRDKGDRQLVNGTVNAAARTAALAASDPALALNPFATGRAASDEVLAGIWSDTDRQNFGRKDLASAFVRGPLLQLPAGAVEAIAGVEAARDRYEAVVPGTLVLNSRTASAAYAELRVPLWRGGADAAAAQDRWTRAALTLAARSDRYSDFGSAGTYQAGLELRPLRSLLLRASAATSFKPPTLLQTSVDDLSFAIELANLTDPRRGGERVTGGEWLRTTNTGLQPEEGRAYTLGALWEPRAGEGPRLGVTAWRVAIDNMIALLTPQVLLDNEALFPEAVERGPAEGGQPGRVTRLRWAEVNFGTVETRGIDVEASYSWSSPLGRWTLGGSATRTTQYDVSLAPGAPITDRLSRRFVDYWAPKWKGRLSAGLDRGPWSLGITSRYLGSYTDAGETPRSLGGSWLHDLSGSLNLHRLGLRPEAAKAASLSLAIVNIGNRLPEYVNSSPYFDVSQADWRGRYASLRFSMDW